MRRIWIVQPYVPAYRVPFFEGLRSQLATDDIDVRVIAPGPTGDLAARGDAAVAEWITPSRNRVWKLGSRNLLISQSSRIWRDGVGVIAPLEGSNLETYAAIARRGSGLRVGLWGHVKNYVTRANPVDVRLEAWQMRTADHVFSYTDQGRTYALEGGLPPEKVTSVHNTVNVEDLTRAKSELSPAEIRLFRQEVGIGHRPTLSYIGGLDASKRVDFLASALDRLWSRDQEVRVLVGGQGQMAGQLNQGVERGQVVLLGRVDNETKARMAAVSAALICPGRVGLVAVEALALGLPLVTTRWPFHAPEIEYLVVGQDVFMSHNSVDAYVDEIVSVLSDRPAGSGHQPPPLSEMVTRFADGVRVMLV